MAAWGLYAWNWLHEFVFFAIMLVFPVRIPWRNAAISVATANISVTETYTTWVTIKWTPINSSPQNGHIFGYYIILYYQGTELQKLYVGGENATTQTIHGLAYCNHLYTVAIAAVNDAGIGMFSTQKPLGAPTGIYRIISIYGLYTTVS